jgi:hypothetical protein
MWLDPPQPDAANPGPTLPGGDREHGLLLDGKHAGTTSGVPNFTPRRL